MGENPLLTASSPTGVASLAHFDSKSANDEQHLKESVTKLMYITNIS